MAAGDSQRNGLAAMPMDAQRDSGPPGKPADLRLADEVTPQGPVSLLGWGLALGGGALVWGLALAVWLH